MTTAAKPVALVTGASSGIGKAAALALVDAVSLEPTAGRLDDSLPRRLLVFLPVPSHTRLRS